MNARAASNSSGVALIAVLWIVAALSIIVSGVVHSVRGEARVVSVAKQSVVGEAQGDAAIHLVLQNMVARKERPARLIYVDTEFQGLAMRVQVLPLNGLIDINQAPEPLLVRLLAVAGGLDAAAASRGAAAIVQARTTKDARGRAIGFEAVEDLLQVPGVDYPLYANISRLVTADQPASGKVNPLAAPEAVLSVLAGGNLERAAGIAAAREAGQTGIDTTVLAADSIDNGTTQRYRIQARVPLPDGAWLLVSRSVDFSEGSQEGLPWRTFHAERRFEAQPGRGS